MVSGEYPPMKGGVSRYTHSLVQALAKKVEVAVATNIAVNNKVAQKGDIDDNFKDGNNTTTIYPLIRKGDKENSDRLLELAFRLKPDIINIQYERGLYEIDTPFHMIQNTLFGTTLDKFYRASPFPTVTTIHTVYPYKEYHKYIRQRAERKAGKLRFLPLPLRAAIRSQIMEQRYRLLLKIVQLSGGIISPARTIHDIVGRGTVIYHGAEPAILTNADYFPLSSMKREEFRKEFGLPAREMLLLAFGYAGFYKGFDILDNLVLPKDWKLVIKQDRHERGNEHPMQVKNAINLNLGYLDDRILSMLFFACNAIIFPYKLVSISGVMFDALAHGLPFVASELEFFKEFADMGLGIVCKRDAKSFSDAIHYLDENYSQYRRSIEQFGPKLQWRNIADRHIEVYSKNISKRSATLST